MESIVAVLRRFFHRNDSKPVPLHHGPLLRSERYELDRRKAIGTAPHVALRQWLHENWRMARDGGEGPFMLFTGGSATGLRFVRDGWVPDRLFRHLLDDLAEQVCTMGYRRQLADVRVDGEGIQRDRIYLKPWPIMTEPPIEQRFGNIALEQWGPVGRVQGMKLLVTAYHDRLYSPAADPAVLFDALFAP